MNYRFIIIFLTLLIFGCEPVKRSEKLNLDLSNKYKNIGFTLIYNENLDIKKKLDNRSLTIFHKSLKNKSSVKITNPENGKTLIAQVKSNKVKFSEFYNSVVSLRIAETLDIDFDEPYVEIVLITNGSAFIAKKTKTFEQEKQVAEKAPIDGIQISDLNNSKSKKNKLIKIKIFYIQLKLQIFIIKEQHK